MSTCVQLDRVESEVDRSATRYRGVALTTASSILSRAVALITVLVTVPLALRFLGLERYGLWMTITSFVLFLSAADLGLGNGLAITIAEADGRNDARIAQQCISSAFFALSAIGAIAILLLAAVYRHVPWDWLYNARSTLARSEVRSATCVLAVCTAVSLPFGIVARVQLGYQKGYRGDLWLSVGNSMALVVIVVFIRMGLGLPWLVLAVGGCPLLASGINWSVQFLHTTPWLRPRLGLIDWSVTCRLAGLGGMFFIQQCFGLTYYLSDNLVISHVLGNAEVAKFSVEQRFFSVGLLSQYVMLPLWPAFREAITRGDTTWARLTLGRALRLNLLIGGGGGLLLLAASHWILKRWAGMETPGIDGMKVGFVLWIVLVGYIATMNAFLNQPGVMKRYLLIFGASTILAVGLKVLCVARFGAAGAVWATIAGYGIAFVVPSYRLAQSWLNTVARNE